MSNLKRYTFQIVASSILSLIALAGARTTVTDVTVNQSSSDLPSLNVEALQGHALELSQREIASTREIRNVRREIYGAVKSQLPAKFKNRAFEISRAVILESNHHKMDPFFLLAVIKTESHFNIKARGLHGEVGLMQIMPKTAKHIALQAGLNPETMNLEDPSTNIRIGATYFASLRRSFNGAAAQYIGAYNMGPTNVRKLAESQLEPTVYPGKVLKNYRGFYVTIARNAQNKNNVVTQPVRPARKLESRIIPASKIRGMRLNTLVATWERA